MLKMNILISKLGSMAFRIRSNRGELGEMKLIRGKVAKLRIYPTVTGDR
jgi:hypothetical protein